MIRPLQATLADCPALVLHLFGDGPQGQANAAPATSGEPLALVAAR